MTTTSPQCDDAEGQGATSPTAPTIRVDLHSHTEFSSDGLMSLERLVQICHKRGLGCIAVTDHNCLEGALRMAATIGELGSLRIIAGEEIRTADGEVIGLFLQREVPRDLPMFRTIELIREQGGIVYLPHPCDRLRRSKIRPAILRDVLPLVDIVETFNARNVFQQDNVEAERLAEEFGLIKAVGSDGHTVMEIGRCYQEMVPFWPGALHQGPDDGAARTSCEPSPQTPEAAGVGGICPVECAPAFLAALREAKLVTHKSALLVHGITKTKKVMNSLGGTSGGTSAGA